jgi:hypothetical protein
MSDSELSKLNSLAIIQQSFPNDDLKLFESTYSHHNSNNNNNNNSSNSSSSSSSGNGGVGSNQLTAHAVTNATTPPTTATKSALFSHFRSPSSLNKNNSIKLHNTSNSSKYSLSLLGTPLLLTHSASRAQSIDKLAKVEIRKIHFYSHIIF